MIFPAETAGNEPAKAEQSKADQQIVEQGKLDGGTKNGRISGASSVPAPASAHAVLPSSALLLILIISTLLLITFIPAIIYYIINPPYIKTHLTVVDLRDLHDRSITYIQVRQSEFNDSIYTYENFTDEVCVYVENSLGEPVRNAYVRLYYWESGWSYYQYIQWASYTNNDGKAFFAYIYNDTARKSLVTSFSPSQLEVSAQAAEREYDSHYTRIPIRIGQTQELGYN